MVGASLNMNGWWSIGGPLVVYGEKILSWIPPWNHSRKNPAPNKFEYFFLGDELDELQFGLKTQTRIFDFSSLKEPKLHFKYFSNFPAIDHNGYIVGEYFFLANSLTLEYLG